MMDNQYLIPANTKRSGLILGYFRGVDIALLGTGSFISLIALAIIGTGSNMMTLIMILSPGFISAALVFPIPNYHNLRVLLVRMIIYFSNRRKYVWKGWEYHEKYR